MRFSKAYRLRKKSEFQDLRTQGSTVNCGLFLLSFVPNSRSCSRVGIIALKKIGGSVVRNRAKRMIREIFRHCVGNIKASLDIVFIPRKNFVDVPVAVHKERFLKFCATLE